MSSRDSGISNLALGVDHYLFGCRVSAISPLRAKSPIIKSSDSIQIEKLLEAKWENERSFISDKSFFGQSRLSAGYGSQNYCENGNDESGERCNGGILLDNKDPQAVAINLRARENGNAILRGLCVGVILLLTYAALKC
jgi:hypothetical protein